MAKERKSKKLIMVVVIVGGILCLSAYFGVRFTQNREKIEITKKIELPLPVESKQGSLPQKEPQPTSMSPTKAYFLPEEISHVNKEIKTLIEKLKSENFQTSQEAAGELVSKRKEAVPLLLEALPRSSVYVKGQIVFILGKIGDSQANPALAEILKEDQNAYLRRNAAEALGKIKNEDTLDTLCVSLFDRDGSVRQRAAWALGELGDTKAIGDLLDRMNDEKDRGVKIQIVRALGKIKDWEATPLLLNELNTGYNQPYKNEVVASLAEIGNREALSGLNGYLDSLMKNRPTEEIYIFEWEEAIRAAEKAIRKIEGAQ